jgi:hypothetical protein
MITVYTVLLNDYDVLRPPAVVEPGVEYVCFSDEFYDVPPWRIVPAPRVFGTAKDSRIPKILSHLFIESEFSIYHDASLRMLVEPSQLVYGDLKDADLALYRHPCRTNVCDEMECCKREGIGYSAEMETQVERYKAFGVDGLYAGGFQIRRNTYATQRFNEIWWREYHNGCRRDQIALPWAIYESDVSRNVIDADIMGDKRFEITWHAQFDHRDNAAFAPAREKRAARRRIVEALCR